MIVRTLICLFLALAATADAQVVLVSFDGFRADYLDRGVTPNFARLAQAGARADALIPIFPSKTFPNHYSIVTGMYAEHHGIVGNEFFDPILGEYRTSNHSDADMGKWFGGEPIWNTAERQGVKSASYFWVGSDVKINGRLPSIWKRYDAHVPYFERVDTVLSWLRLPELERPKLVLLYFEIMDEAGHAFGPASPQVDSALAKADSILGRLMSGLSKQTTLIVVSDHGMVEVAPQRRVPVDSLVDLNGVRVIAAGPYSTLYFGADTVRRNDALQKLKMLPHSKVYARDSIPARYHWRNNPRIPDVLMVADEGWMVGPRRIVERTQPGGQHGYDPQVKAVQGIFLTAGPRIAPGQRIAAFENIHIYPYITQILGIQPGPEIDGDARVLQTALKRRD